MDNDHIFICYEKNDRNHVDSIIAKSSNDKNLMNFWASHINKISDGENYEDEIENQILSSKGAILLVSETFLNSDFINRFELPRIFKMKERNEDYKISIVLVEDCDYSNNEFLTNKQFTVPRSMALNTLSRGTYLIIIDQILEVFNPVLTAVEVEEIIENERQKEINKKEEISSSLKKERRRVAIFTVVLGILIYPFARNVIRDPVNEIITEEVSQNQKNSQEIYLSYLEENLTYQKVGQIEILTEYDLLAHGNWICKTLENKVRDYFVYDGVWLLIAGELNKYNISGDEITTEQMGSGQYYIFHGANNYLCDNTVDTSNIENKYNLHKFITTSDYEWRSNLWRDQISGAFLDYLVELLDTTEPSISTLGYIEGQDEFYELLIAGCETILPMEVEEYLDFINNQFADTENLEDQNVIWDFQDIMLLIVPQIFCPEYVEKGLQLSTYIYVADFKF
tara:strand:+ start:1528 stop:2889 length:1362 start_codon:yes stop_codon:yes gene_type:complete